MAGTLLPMDTHGAPEEKARLLKHFPQYRDATFVGCERMEWGLRLWIVALEGEPKMVRPILDEQP